MQQHIHVIISIMFMISSIAGDPVIIPSNLLFAIWNFVDYMAGYAQQDAHEFLIAFLNSLDQQLQVNSAENVCSFKDVRMCESYQQHVFSLTLL